MRKAIECNGKSDDSKNAPIAAAEKIRQKFGKKSAQYLKKNTKIPNVGLGTPSFHTEYLNIKVVYRTSMRKIAATSENEILGLS